MRGIAERREKKRCKERRREKGDEQKTRGGKRGRISNRERKNGRDGIVIKKLEEEETERERRRNRDSDSV